MLRNTRGITATAITSVSAEPPLILACLHRDTGTFKMVQETGVIGINFLDTELRNLSVSFAGRTGLQGDARFHTPHWEAGAATGVPILRSGATTLECEVQTITEAGTHGIVLGLVKHAQVREIDPLIYHAGDFQMLRPTMQIAS